MKNNSGSIAPTQRKLGKRLRLQWELQVFALLGVAFLLIFGYAPLAGVIIAFKDYSIQGGFKAIITSNFNHFAHFKEFFGFYKFWQLFRNTLVLSITKLIFTFPAPILLAILLSEMRCVPVRRVIQTISYLPNFISFVLVYTLANAFQNSDYGALQFVLKDMGLIKESIPFLTAPQWFVPNAVFWAVWKSSGWWAIIFLASITGIDQGLYEAAEIDGAGRLRRIWHITLPGIKSTCVVVLILSIGSLLGGSMGGSNFDQAFIFGNPTNNATSEIIQTYAFNMGLAQGRFAFATAVDLVQSCISIFLVVTSNFISKKLAGEGLF